MSCISRSKVPLRDYQITAIKFISDPNNNSLMVVHGTGTGKTLTALVASQCYLELHPHNNIIVISPASLVGNFKKEMVKYGSELSNNYKFYSFDKFISVAKYGLSECDKSMVIIDEVHNMRNMKARYEAIYNCVVRSDKLLILTATPFVNSLLDLKSIIYLLYRDNRAIKKNGKFISDVRPINVNIGLNKKIEYFADLFNKYVKQDDSYDIVLNNIGYMLYKKVSFIDDKNSEHFPKVKIHKIEMQMSQEFYNKYEKAIKVDKNFGISPEKFFQGYRQAVNSIGDISYTNEKINNILNIVKRGERTVIYTNWLENGVYILTDLMIRNKITYSVISGATSPNMRMGIVEYYNSGLFSVLIITKAGSEGLDLKETRNIIVMDPVWNYSTLEQIIGRGVRFNSHANLPREQRVVNVYLLILKSPTSRFYTYIPSGDELLQEILERKEIIKKDVEKVLKMVSI
jgi:superfamily II DNA or RNA helicase